MEEIDIWRAAKLLVDQHGADAELEACQRADKALDEGDLRGVGVWKRVRDAVAALSRHEPPAGEQKH